MLTVRVPLAVRKSRGGWSLMVAPSGTANHYATAADTTLVKAVVRAFRYQRMLDQGRYASIIEMAVAERIERGYLGSLLRLTLLAPDIVEAVLDGRQDREIALPSMMRPFSLHWATQFGQQ